MKEKAWIARRRALLKLLTDERNFYLNLLRVAAERWQTQEGKHKQPAAIEVTAQPSASPWRTFTGSTGVCGCACTKRKHSMCK